MNRNKCDECGGKIVKKLVDFGLYGVSLGKFNAEVCTKCGEECFDEETSDMIDEVAKAKGLWTEVLKQDPNNPAPYFFLGELHIKEGNLKEGILEISNAILLRSQGH